MNKRLLFILISIVIAGQMNAQNEAPQFQLYKLATKTNEPIVKKVEPQDLLSPTTPTLLLFSMYFEACRPCVEEIDTLYKNLKPFIDKGDLNFAVVASLNDSALAHGAFLSSFAKQKKWAFPVYMDLKSTLADFVNIGSSFPKYLVIDNSGMARYHPKAGKSNKEQIARLKDIISQLTTLTNPEEITHFTLADLKNMMTNAEQYNSGTASAKLLQAKGFLNTADHNFSQVATNGKSQFISWNRVGEQYSFSSLSLQFSSAEDCLSYQQDFERNGFKVFAGDKPGEKTFQNTEMSFTTNETDKTVTLSLIPKIIDAVFPGGEASWKKYLKDSTRYNVALKNNAPVGRYEVIVTFMIDTKGDAQMVSADTKHGYGIEQEAIRVIKASPTWQPGTKNGKPEISFKKQTLYFIVEEE